MLFEKRIDALERSDIQMKSFNLGVLYPFLIDKYIKQPCTVLDYSLTKKEIKIHYQLNESDMEDEVTHFGKRYRFIGKQSAVKKDADSIKEGLKANGINAIIKKEEGIYKVYKQI